MCLEELFSEASSTKEDMVKEMNALAREKAELEREKDEMEKMREEAEAAKERAMEMEAKNAATATPKTVGLSENLQLKVARAAQNLQARQAAMSAVLNAAMAELDLLFA